MIEPTNHTSALLCGMDAKFDRLQSDLTDLRGRLQRAEGRPIRVDASLAYWKHSTAKPLGSTAAPTSTGGAWLGSSTRRS